MSYLHSLGSDLTYAAQNVGRLWQVAIRINPRVAEMVMSRKPSARAQTSRTFDSGMKTAAEIASATTYMTLSSECDSKSLMTNGSRFDKIEDWKAFTKYRNQILVTPRKYCRERWLFD